MFRLVQFYACFMNTLNIYKVKDMNIQKTTAYVRFLILLTRDKNETFLSLHYISRSFYH